MRGQLEANYLAKNDQLSSLEVKKVRSSPLEQLLIVILYNMVTDAPMCEILGSKPETKAQPAPYSALFE